MTILKTAEKLPPRMRMGGIRPAVCCAQSAPPIPPGQGGMLVLVLSAGAADREVLPTTQRRVQALLHCRLDQ